MSSGGRTKSARPAATAAPGMPKTTLLASSWARTRPPARRTARRPSTPSAAHAGQNDGDGRRAVDAGDGLEEVTGRGTETAEGALAASATAPGSDPQVAVVGGKVDRPRGQFLSLLGHLHPQVAGGVEPGGQPGGEAVGDVLHHQDRHREVAGQRRQQAVQRRRPAGRGGDGNHAVGRGPGRPVGRARRGGGRPPVAHHLDRPPSP